MSAEVTPLLMVMPAISRAIAAGHVKEAQRLLREQLADEDADRALAALLDTDPRWPTVAGT